MLLEELRHLGLQRVGLVADGLKGLEEAVARSYPGTAFQLCATHVKRRLLTRVHTEDKPLLAKDLRHVFATDRRDDTPEKGWQHWQALCKKWRGKYRQFATLKTEPDTYPINEYRGRRNVNDDD